MNSPLADKNYLNVHVVEFKRRRWQREALSQFTRFVCLNVHRGAGKTILVTNYLMRQAIEIHGSQYVYVVPTFAMGMRSFWENMVKFTHGIPGWSSNKQDKYWAYDPGNGISSKIWMVSCDDGGDNIRGVHPHGLVVDEAQKLPVTLWQEILRPTLNNQKGWAIILGTPNGKDNLLYWAYDNGNNPAMKEWSQFTYDVHSTKVFSEEEVEAIRLEQDDDTFKQEFLCSFVKSSNEVVFNQFDPAVHVRPPTDLPDDDRLPVLVGMDFNINPMSAVVAIQRGDQLHIIDEIVLPNSHTGDMAEEIANKYRGRRIQIYPDQSGRSGRTSAVGETDFTILRRTGFYVYENRSGNPPVLESIKTVNMMLRPVQGGEPKILISAKCKNLVQCMDRLRFKPGSSIVDKTQGYDHMTDALRYLITFMSPYVAKRRATVEGFRL
ncbi:P-loop protein (plasmid) [Azospirillum baldaniorum]|uniref:P-loop protein n=1 Tax=Azospirillum baldaniorum TaxID=1064539 RepID=A0A9P1JY93_9PROT|nr:P-loop protein [Azospirillum baldaniorum]AWJ93835.1 P-loop protein [Azospirillum baldaniorum]TWA81658.1 terminase family protein [Azospirillum brasilense]CCD01994.1 putative P-loop protein [Azospirillum baldaniorum]